MIRNLRFTALAVATIFAYGGCEMANNATKKDDGKKDSGGGGGGGGAAAYDMRDNLTVYTPQGNWPKDGAGLKEGWFVEKTTKTAAGTSTTKWAVVAAAGDSFKVETN